MRTLLLFALLALAPIAFADPYPQLGDCTSGGTLALERIEITGGTAESTFYVDDEGYLLGSGIWIYPEWNGVWTPKPPGIYSEGHSNENLQRGGSSEIIAASPDTRSDPDICVDNADLGPDKMLL
jgi:hypothetical protein